MSALFCSANKSSIGGMSGFSSPRLGMVNDQELTFLINGKICKTIADTKEGVMVGLMYFSNFAKI